MLVITHRKDLRGSENTYMSVHVTVVIDVVAWIDVCVPLCLFIHTYAVCLDVISHAASAYHIRLTSGVM